MQGFYLIMILTIAVVTLYYVAQGFRREAGNKLSSYVTLGLIVGMTLGTASALAFYALDSTKGWNPYGWWYTATLVVTAISGLLTSIVFGVLGVKRIRRMGRKI